MLDEEIKKRKNKYKTFEIHHQKKHVYINKSHIETNSFSCSIDMVRDSSKRPLWEGVFIRGRRLKEEGVYFIFPTILGAFIGGRRLKEGGIHWRIYGILLSTVVSATTMLFFTTLKIAPCTSEYL